MILTTIKAKVNTPAAQVAANAEELCGFTDWQIGIEKDVTGLNCIENLPSSGGDFFQIFFLGDDRLFVGEIDDDHSGETADERPETLEAMPFEK